METIISACISAGVTLAICLITQHAQSAKDRALLEYKLDELSRRVDRHNQLIERTYELEKKVDVQDTRIGNLEKKVEQRDERILD